MVDNKPVSKLRLRERAEVQRCATIVVSVVFEGGTG